MRTLVSSVVICFSLVGLVAAQTAHAAIKKMTHIEAQGLEAALHQFAKDRDVQVVFRSEVVDDLRTGGAAGDLTVSEALTQLLSGTGLTFQYLDEKTVTVLPAAGASTSSSARTTQRTSFTDGDGHDGSKEDAQKSALWDRVAQLDQGSSASGGGSAAPADTGESVKLEEVIVTAQKREERLIDVPLSIVALSADELTKRQITSIDDLALVVPGMSTYSSGSYFRTIILRGTANIFGNGPVVGLYLDDIAVSSVNGYDDPDLRTYDLERVEVLRGPQGTLYGQGSMGGTIRFITKDPQLNSFGMDADVAALFTPEGRPGQRIQAVVNVPLIEDKVGLRIAGTFDHEGGWIDQPAANKTDYNDENLMNVRVKGLWQITPEFKANVMAIVHRNQAPSNVGEDEHGNYTQVFGLLTSQNIQDNYDIYAATLTYDTDFMRVLSSTSYLSMNKDYRNFGRFAQIPDPPPNPRQDFYEPQRVGANNIFNEEFRLASVGSQPCQWTVGAFYRDGRNHQNVPVGYFAFPTVPGELPANHFSSELRNESKAVSIFGDTSVKISRLTIGAGLRYFHDDEDNRSGASGALGPEQSASFHAVSPRVHAEYGLADRVNVYTSAAKGFRSGGLNGFDNTGNKLPTYGPENLWTYELGTKMQLAENRLSADAALFYSDYKGYQVNGFVVGPNNQPLDILSNAGKARIKGVEWQVMGRPVKQWTFGVNGDYLDTRFYAIAATSTAYNVGDNLDFAPKYQYTVFGQRDFQWDGRPGFLRLDYNSKARDTFRNRSIGYWYFSESDVIHMLNLDVSLHWSDQLSLGFFAQNLLNDRGYLNGSVIEQSSPRSRPFTFGFQFGVELN